MLKVVLAVLVSLNVWAQSNEESVFNSRCGQSYRVATTDLLTVIKGFQEKRLDSTETAGAITAVASQVRLVRGMCLLTESPQARNCSDRYKEVYREVSAKVSPGALLTGNQTEIDANFLFVKRIEVKLALIDARCQ